MSLVTKKTEIIDHPRKMILYSPPKTGKTTAISHLPDVGMVDLEDGTGGVTGNIFNIRDIIKEHDVSGWDALIMVYKELLENNPFKFLVFDTVDVLETFATEEVLRLNEVEFISDVPYGAGYKQLADKVLMLVNKFAELAVVILIGHRKRTIIGETEAVQIKDLTLTGKLKDYVLSDMDAVAYAKRETSEEGFSYFTLSFITAKDESVTAGTRVERLDGREIKVLKSADGEFSSNWSVIYPFIDE